MFFQFLVIFIWGIAIGFGLGYHVVSAIVQYGIDKGKIKFEILRK